MFLNEDHLEKLFYNQIESDVCDGNKMAGSIWKSPTTTGGKSCNYLPGKHSYYKGDEIVGKLALGIRLDMNSDSVALIINHVWKSGQVWTPTVSFHTYISVYFLWQENIVSNKRADKMVCMLKVAWRKKSFSFLAQKRWSVELNFYNNPNLEPELNFKYVMCYFVTSL